MRILIAGAFPEVHTHPRGGVEAVVWQLARHLAMLPDTEVHVTSSERHATRAARVVEGVTVHFAPPRRQLPGLLASATTAPAYVRQLAQQVRADLVHGFGLGGDGIGAVASGLPHLLAPRSQPQPPRRRTGPVPLARAQELATASVGNWPLRHADHVAVVSPYVREVFAPLVRGRLHDLAPPVAPEFFDVFHTSRPDSQPTLLAVGNMVERKRHDLALRTLAVVRREVPDARLRIAGHIGTDGQVLLGELRELAGRLAVLDAVDFLGGVSQPQLLREYAEADLLLHTAADATSPLAITQAMASGLPIVAVDIPGVRHLVEPGVTGVRAQPATPRGVAAEVVGMLGDPEAAGTLAITARARAHRAFEPLGVARRTRELYDRIASS